MDLFILSISQTDSADVWLTVPAAWDARGCQMMRDAAITAGLVRSSRAGDNAWKERLRVITYVCTVLRLGRRAYFVIPLSFQRARGSCCALRLSYGSSQTQAESNFHGCRRRRYVDRQRRQYLAHIDHLSKVERWYVRESYVTAQGRDLLS